MVMKKPTPAAAMPTAPATNPPTVIAAEPADAPVVPDAAPSDAPEAATWMKLKTGLSGPELSLSPGDVHSFSTDEAERLFLAGFAEPCDPPVT